MMSGDLNCECLADYFGNTCQFKNEELDTIKQDIINKIGNIDTNSTTISDEDIAADSSLKPKSSRVSVLLLLWWRCHK